MRNLLELEDYALNTLVGLCVLIIVVGCSQSPTQPAAVYVTPHPSAAATLPPAGCFGLFVAGVDRYTEHAPFQPRYIVGEPITVTATVLVFDEGHLILTTGRILNDYTISVTDRQGQPLPLTKQGRHITGTDHGPNIGGILVEHDTPYTAIFRIEEWFDFSHTGVYTLNLTRRVWVAGVAQTITGNTVSISIIPPPP